MDNNKNTECIFNEEESQIVNKFLKDFCDKNLDINGNPKADNSCSMQNNTQKLPSHIRLLKIDGQHYLSTPFSEKNIEIFRKNNKPFKIVTINNVLSLITPARKP